ncbi:MAG: response regulator [Candidatus Aceula lacicola]|nr:response regulator [Candidatus Aceula lacicola]
MSKLLIVDDEQDVREFAKNFFVKRNIDVRTAPGGAEALKLIDEDKPDLVLLDVRMGDMTGIEVLQELRAKGSDVKVIMVTGVEDQDVIDEAKSLGVVNYVHKPLALDELEQIVLSQLN